MKRPYDRVIGGVCAAMADRMHIDAICTRIAALLLLVVASPVALLLYLAFWVAIPEEEDNQFVPLEVRPEGGVSEVSSFQKEGARSESLIHQRHAAILLFVGLVLLTVILCLVLEGAVPQHDAWAFSPILLMCVGIAIAATPIIPMDIGLRIFVGASSFGIGFMMLFVLLGIVSPYSIPDISLGGSGFLVAALVLLFLGQRAHSTTLFVAAGLVVLAFCLIGMWWFGVPGDHPSLLVKVPMKGVVLIDFWRSPGSSPVDLLFYDAPHFHHFR